MKLTYSGRGRRGRPNRSWLVAGWAPDTPLLAGGGWAPEPPCRKEGQSASAEGPPRPRRGLGKSLFPRGPWGLRRAHLRKTAFSFTRLSATY